MSSKSSRRPGDRYLTPDWATAALLQAVPELGGELLIDPCCGDARMAKQVRSRFRGMLLNDIDPAAQAAGFHLDAARAESWAQWLSLAGVGWVVTNPPFSHAGAIAWHALQAGHHLALLLRITFLEPTQARSWLTHRPPTAMVVLPRIDFIGAGTVDSATYAWLLWGPVRPGIQIVRADSGYQLGLQGVAEPSTFLPGEPRS